MVTSTGFGPVNAAVKGRCVKPLHQLARATAHVYYHNGIRKTLLPYQNDPGQRRIAAQTPGRVCDMITSP